MALDLRTRQMESPFPRETVRLVRADVLAGLGKTVALRPAPAPARTPLTSTVAMAPPLVAAARPLPPPMRMCSPTADARLFMLADRGGAQAAAFRVLADTLVTKGLPRILGVTSAAAGEGKTTCAINLALALAENRRERVLLLDACGSAQDIAPLLGIDESEAAPSPNGAWTAPFALSALTPSLHVATLARRAGQPSYIDFTTLGRLLETFQRAGYAQIILDMPALEGSNEADLLLPVAGGVLLAVRSGRSTSRALRRAATRIGPRKALGITLMDAPV